MFDIDPFFLLFEAVMIILFLGSLWHASRQGKHRVMELVVALVYGVALEYMTLRQVASYEYGQFLMMLDDAPISIGLGWAVIIYSAMTFSDRIQLPEAARPFLDGLLALNIDFAMDTIAIRLYMWDWNIVAMDQEWFGVPWGNLWAWFIVVTSYSFFIRLLRGWQQDRIRVWLYAPLSFVLSLTILALTNALYTYTLAPNALGFLGMAVLLGSGLIIVIGSRPRVLHPGPPEPIVIAVPVVFHVLFMAAGIIYGFYAELPALAVVGVVMLVVGVAVHLWPWIAYRRENAA